MSDDLRLPGGGKESGEADGRWGLSAVAESDNFTFPIYARERPNANGGERSKSCCWEDGGPPGAALAKKEKTVT